MNRIVVTMVVLFGCASARIGFAAEHAGHAPATQHAQTKSHGESHAIAYDHPAIPEPAPWAGATVIVILGMFLLAAAVGVGVRMNAPDEMPPTHSHDEPPGTSGHHGPGGTVQPGPEHDLPGGHAHHH